MPIEIVMAVILVSFLIFVLGSIAGAVIVLAIYRYQSHASVSGQELPSKLVNRGYQLGVFSIIFALCYCFRILLVMQTGQDFSPKDWLAFDLAYGVYMFFMSAFVFSILHERKKMFTKPTDFQNTQSREQ